MNDKLSQAITQAITRWRETNEGNNHVCVSLHDELYRIISPLIDGRLLCPLCGGRSEVVDVPPGCGVQSWRYFVRCYGRCFMAGPKELTSERAIEQWKRIKVMEAQ